MLRLIDERESNPVARPADVDVADGLIGWWKLDEKSGMEARDSAGGHHGKLVGMTGAEWGAGCVGGGVKFDGGDDCIVTADFSSPTSAITISCWVKSDTVN